MPGEFVDLGQDAVELLLRADQRIDVLDRRDLGDIARPPRGDGDQRFAGRVRDQMQMEVAASGHAGHSAGTSAVDWRG